MAAKRGGMLLHSLVIRAVGGCPFRDGEVQEVFAVFRGVAGVSGASSEGSVPAATGGGRS